MIEVNDVEQMLHSFNVEFEVMAAGDILFKVPLFGLQIIFSPTKLAPKSTHTSKGWRVVEINVNDDFEEKKMEIFWQLMRAGYIHYIRMEFSNTFKRMITSNNWDKVIIEKRLELYDDDPKYVYLRDYNNWAKKQSATYLLSMDPGFYDFLLDQEA